MTPAQRLAVFREGLHPVLAAALDERVGRFGPDLEAFEDPTGQPVLLLVRWLGGLDAQRQEDIEAAALFGYLCVRVHDDFIDDGEGEPGTALLLAHRLQLEHDHLMALHAPDPRYQALHRARWAAYGAAMAEERLLASGARPWDEAAFTRVLDRSRPLVLPGAATLLLQNRWSDLPHLLTLIDALVSAHQRFDDLTDVTSDRASGRSTLATSQFSVTFVDQEFARARAELARAEDAARALGAMAALPWLNARRSGMEAWRRELLRRVFEGVGTSES